MTAKEYLQRGWRIEQRMERLIDEKAHMEALIYSGRRPKLTGMPRGARGDWTDAVDRLDALMDKYRDDILELARIKREVHEAVESVEDLKQRTVLQYRYCSYWSWERIAAAMNYELRWVYQLHGRALLRVEEYLRMRSEE